MGLGFEVDGATEELHRRVTGEDRQELGRVHVLRREGDEVLGGCGLRTRGGAKEPREELSPREGVVRRQRPREELGVFVEVPLRGWSERPEGEGHVLLIVERRRELGRAANVREHVKDEVRILG